MKSKFFTWKYWKYPTLALVMSICLTSSLLIGMLAYNYELMFWYYFNILIYGGVSYLLCYKWVSKK